MSPASDADDDVDRLKFVDPELRTTALLLAVGIDADEYDDASFQYIDSENFDGHQSEFYTFIEIYGKCTPDILEIIQKQLRRSLERVKDSWEDVWQGNPLDAVLYNMEISPDKKYFKMYFEFADESLTLEELNDIIFDGFYDSGIDTVSELHLFLYADYFKEYSNDCEYYIVKPVIDEDYDNVVEHKKWEFSTSDYEDHGREVNDMRLNWIKKKLALWLAEGTKDKTVLKKMKNDLLEAEQTADKAEKDRRL